MEQGTGKVLDKTGGTFRGVPFAILRFCPWERLGGRRPPQLGFLKIGGLISTPDLVQKRPVRSQTIPSRSLATRVPSDLESQ